MLTHDLKFSVPETGRCLTIAPCGRTELWGVCCHCPQTHTLSSQACPYTKGICHLVKILGNYVITLLFVFFFLSFFKNYLFLFYLWECFASMYFCAPHACSTHGDQKRASWPLDPELTDGCDQLLYGCWEPNPDPLQK